MEFGAGNPSEDIPADEHGASLLIGADEADRFRRRRRRPAELGRYLLLGLGGVCAGAGGALWLTAAGSRLVGVAFVGFGLTLVALGGTLHFVLVRDRDRWPERAHAWDEGIEILLHDGELRAASWTDPEVALDLFVRPRRNSTEDDRLLVWRMDSGIPPADLSEAGLARLMEVVVAHDLRLSEYRRGRRAREARAYEIRGRDERRSVDVPVTSASVPKSSP